MKFYIWNKRGFNNLKRKRVSQARASHKIIFYGAPLNELRGLDNYAYIENLRVMRGF